MKIHGYSEQINNAVYSADIPEGKSVIVTQRFTYPSPNDILVELCSTASKLVKNMPKPGQEMEPFDFLVVSLPDDCLEKLSKEPEEYLPFVKENIPTQVFHGGVHGAEYVLLSLCVKPSDYEFPELGEFLDSLSESEQQVQWNLSLRLLNGRLPERKHVDIMINHRVVASDTLDVSGEYKAPQLEYFIDVLYSNLDSKNKIMTLPDTSHRILENTSTWMAYTLLQSEQQKKMMKMVIQQSSGVFGPGNITLPKAGGSFGAN